MAEDFQICARRCCLNLVIPPKSPQRFPKIYCSDRCGRLASRARAEKRKRDAKAVARAAHTGICRRPGCGKACAQPGRRGPCPGYCSPACRELNANRAFDNGARRVLLAGFGAEIESFTALEILDRDGWRCQRCGCDTPRELRGSKFKQAPEVDHKIPISRGGAHTRVNCWCLCHGCNSFKKNRLIEELPPPPALDSIDAAP